MAFERDNILINPYPRKHMYITKPNSEADVYPNSQALRKTNVPVNKASMGAMVDRQNARLE